MNINLIYRFFLLKISEDSYNFIWTSHHIMLDGWSISVLLNLLNEFYSNKPPSMSPIDYCDFIYWICDQPKENAKNYWKNYLRSYTGTTHLPLVAAEKHSSKIKKILKTNNF